MTTVRALAGLAVCFAACFAGELDVTGKACPCPGGWFCDPERGCVPDEVGMAGGGHGGEGGSACVDADDDGVTDCQGDCDEANPFIHPGAVEQCGDLVANDCEGEADQASLCMGLGTFVANVTGCSDTGTGIQTEPLCTIGAGLAHASTIGNDVDVFVGQGLYPEKVVLTLDRASLYGGFCCAALPCTWERDREACESSIPNGDLEGVAFATTITRQTRFDGFRVVGQDGDGTAALTLTQATPIIANSTFVAGDGATSHGIYVLTGSVNDAAGALIENNVFELATGTTLYGIRVEAAVEIVGNELSGGDGQYLTDIDVSLTSDPVLIQQNVIVGASAVNGSSTAIALDAVSDVVIDGNLVNAGAVVGSCGGSQPPWCAAVSLLASSATLQNNVIVGMTGTQGAAVLIFESDGPEPAGPETIINGNILSGGASSFSTISAAIAYRSQTDKGSLSGRIRNNILLGGVGSTRYGIYEDNGPGVTLKPQLIEHNDFFECDEPYREWVGSSAVHHDLAALNALAFADDNFDSNCGLSSFHLPSGSPCIDAGTPEEAPALDIDGEERPAGAAIDVGADEVP